MQRRILHTMRLLRLNPTEAFKKCAKIVGDVMGNFHPHGDAAIYDALVRLAQDFSVRYPMVDGQGNFGNVDGDPAAAYRYTEARMTAVATLMMEGIGEDAVDFRPTYNEEDAEPIVLPGAFPNLLANGSTGIAVGMATSVPPHNADELCRAAQHLIKRPDASVETLMGMIEGPDFPTGGIVVDGRAAITEAHRTGRGGFRLRARWEREDLGRGGWQVVVTQVPYQVQKAKLVERIAELVNTRKLPLLEDVRDESAEDVRLVLVPRSRNVDPELLMASLFRLTDLENRIPLNMNVLSKGRVPRVMGLTEVLREWLDHRREVLVRRTDHRLAEIDRRMEVLAGLLIAYLNLDEVIAIIREADEPKRELIARFELTDVQADSILNMRLRSLNKLQEIELTRENEALRAERDGLDALLASEGAQWKAVSTEIGRVRKLFGKSTEIGARRTTFGEAAEIDLRAVEEAMIEREPVTIVISAKGWARALKGHGADLTSLAFKEGDALAHAFPAVTTDKVLLLTDRGRYYTVGADRLPGGRGHGEPVRLMADMAQDEALVAAHVAGKDAKRLLVSDAGYGFVVAEGEMVANTRKGRQAMNVGEGVVRAAVPPPAITSPSWARTASCSSSRSPRCPRWRAARACACNATRTAARSTRAASPPRPASPGSTAADAPTRAAWKNCATGWATAAWPAGWRREGSRRRGGSGGRGRWACSDITLRLNTRPALAGLPSRRVSLSACPGEASDRHKATSDEDRALSVKRWDVGSLHVRDNDDAVAARNQSSVRADGGTQRVDLVDPRRERDHRLLRSGGGRVAAKPVRTVSAAKLTAAAPPAVSAV